MKKANLSKLLVRIGEPVAVKRVEKWKRKLGRKLLMHEHVHHIDGDFTNQEDTNLELKVATEHLREHALERIAKGLLHRPGGWRMTDAQKILIGNANRLPDKKIARILEEYSKGTLIDAICEIVGCSRPSVYRYVNTNKLERRYDIG